MAGSQSSRLHEALKDQKEQELQSHLRSLWSTKSVDFSLGKASRRMKRLAQCESWLRSEGGNWTRGDVGKGAVFVKHLVKIFLTHLPLIELWLPKVSTLTAKGKHQKNAPGYELITTKMLKERNHPHDMVWKILEITMISNCGKGKTQVTSYTCFTKPEFSVRI